MEYVQLGKTGLKVSPLCLGCMTYGVPDQGGHPWSLDEPESRPFLERAWDAGINFFDTANSYSAGTSEAIVGRALKEFAPRDEVVIATKVFFSWKKRPNCGGLSRKAIFTAVDDSLRRLGTDYIDLYQIHRWDYHTPIEETLEALHDVVKAGKVRYLGVSSMFAWQFAKSLYLADAHGWTRFATMQPQYSLLYREEEREMLPLCAAEGIGVIPWSPIARGKLARPWTAQQATNRSTNDDYANKLFAKTADLDRPIIDTVEAIAAAREVPMAQIALAWVMSNPVITAPIVGISKLQHLEDALAALEIVLTDEEIETLESCYTPREVMAMR
ncbi:aldo/keto reductase [Blastopirellula sp. JC732]|uniref:Aldo/keto reductase n=1 Tax=Blastopirellula sediminis TaxID=2894196 RepID=A0A9X1SHH6_9BACT|nr:aldo/keto reductase [Blastopirellula sediminis]MCC9606555.1 aldo/keto reductase [Blastopirellula sediminis]MCC9630147.1 aldo/keto reductase [Blastopirellula sediminis]